MHADQPEASVAAFGPRRTLLVPEVRDYQLINRQVTLWLEQGVTHITLQGAERQRLLLAGLRGPWRAVIEVVGDAGPELAAELDAQDLGVVCHGSCDDGAGRSLAAGSLVLCGPAAACVGYRQRGGLILAASAVGARAGLEQSGGTLILHGPVDPLCGERQRGGVLVITGNETPRHLGRGRCGGTVWQPAVAPLVGADAGHLDSLHRRIARLQPMLLRLGLNTIVRDLDIGSGTRCDSS